MVAPRYWLVMPAAGSGERMQAAGDRVPKQYLTIAGRTVIEHALAPFLADRGCAGIVVALKAGDAQFASLPCARDQRVATVEGGARRADSVRAGLDRIARAVGSEDPWVLVHDAARPCLPRRDLAALLDALAAAPAGALLGLPIADTVKRADADGGVLGTVPREGLWRAATPQAFRLRRLIQALERAHDATDESSAIETLGDRPRLVVGSAANLKLTTTADLELAGRLLEGHLA